MDESKFQIGDIVRISRRSFFYGECSIYNPKNKNGVIVEFIDTHIHVDWNVNKINEYNESDLRLVERPIGE